MEGVTYNAPTIIWRLQREDVFAYAIFIPHAIKTRLLWWINDRIEGNEEFVDWAHALERSEAVRRQLLEDGWTDVT
jgi:hypothetical protein